MNIQSDNIKLVSRRSIVVLKQRLVRLGAQADKLITRLYQQKHAFHFRCVQRWRDHAEVRIVLYMKPPVLIRRTSQECSNLDRYQLSCAERDIKFDTARYDRLE